MASRARWTVGALVKIPLPDGAFAFGRLLEFPLIAFYDVRSSASDRVTVQSLASANIAFILWVMKYAVTKGHWPIVDRGPLEGSLWEPPLFFLEDAISGELFTTYGGGVEQPASFAEVEGLERAAVWDPEHVVDRLVDHFAGRPNKWVESMRPRG